MQNNEEMQKVQENIDKEHATVQSVLDEIGKRIVGQKNMVEKLLLGLLTGGHVLLEGVPGLAKTMAISTMAEVIDTDFQRIQFTPDLLPSDLIGTLIYNQKKSTFDTKKGPLFTNMVLADEINRAPAKVQSALLEAMQEKHVTIGDTTFSLPDPFMVLATENPVEQEGTYPLPEAQVDRFMLKVSISYPQQEEELEIIKRHIHGHSIPVVKLLNPERITKLRDIVESVYLDERIMRYIVSLVFATREPAKYKLDPELIAYGASPRASLYLAVCAKANAFFQKRAFVIPEDIRMIGMDVLRHRIIPSYEAEAEGVISENLVERVFENVEVP